MGVHGWGTSTVLLLLVLWALVLPWVGSPFNPREFPRSSARVLAEGSWQGTPESPFI